MTIVDFCENSTFWVSFVYFYSCHSVPKSTINLSLKKQFQNSFFSKTLSALEIDLANGVNECDIVEFNKRAIRIK